MSAPKPTRAQATSGFPSPADESAEASLDVRDLLVTCPAATFYVRMRGNAQAAAGVFPGDVLVVDRSLTPTPGRLVIVTTGGTLRVARWQLQPGAAGENVSEAALWGVVTYVIHQADALPEGASAYPALTDALDVE